MAGRGKGKGGKGKGGKGSGMMVHDLIRANAEDMGMDQRGMASGPPPLWPEIEGGIPSLMPMTEEDRMLVEKERSLTKRMRESPYYIDGDKQLEYRIPRWSDRNRVSLNKHEILQAVSLTK